MTPNTKLPESKPPIKFSKQFSKDWKYLKHDNFKQKFIFLLKSFVIDPMDVKFRNHELNWAFEWFRSIDITWDIRAVYVYEDWEYLFLRIWSHSYLYW